MNSNAELFKPDWSGVTCSDRLLSTALLWTCILSWGWGSSHSSSSAWHCTPAAGNAITLPWATEKRTFLFPSCACGGWKEDQIGYRDLFQAFRRLWKAWKSRQFSSLYLTFHGLLHLLEGTMPKISAIADGIAPGSRQSSCHKHYPTCDIRWIRSDMSPEWTKHSRQL